MINLKSIIPNINALIRGYVIFYVNSDMFLTYYNAKAKRLELSSANLNYGIIFKGYNIFLGWKCFYLTMVAFNTTNTYYNKDSD